MSDWPDRLDSCSPEQKVRLMLEDPDRYFAMSRKEAGVWARRYVAEQMAKRAAERAAQREAAWRALPWWRKPLAWLRGTS